MNNKLSTTCVRLGAVILFSAWVFQQPAPGEGERGVASNRCRRECLPYYQSNNALFNAIATKEDKVEEIRRFQTSSYLHGLKDLADVTSVPVLVNSDIPSERVNEWRMEVERRKSEIRKEIDPRRNCLALSCSSCGASG